MTFPFIKIISVRLPFLTGAFSTVLEWVIHNGYPLMFLGMIIEGPTITAAASFANTLGHFNLSIIFILAVLGDLVGDFIWYTLGYFGRTILIPKHGHFLGVTEQKIEKLSRLLEKHPVKIITAIKLSPVIPVPGLIITGISRLSPKKFAIIIALIILPKTLLFMSLGYFFGQIYEKISGYINSGIYAIGLILLIAFISQYILKRTFHKFSKKLSDRLGGI